MAKIPKRRRGGQRRRRARTLAEFQALSARWQATAENVAHVVTRVREGASLNSAAVEFGIDPRTVIAQAKSALRKTTTGRYRAKSSDDLLRVLNVVVDGRREAVAVRGSRTASELSNYAQATRTFASTGRTEELLAFRGRAFTDAQGRKIAFFTDLDELERLGDLGELSFEDLYARR
jgi:hypothetical protein